MSIFVRSIRYFVAGDLVEIQKYLLTKEMHSKCEDTDEDAITTKTKQKTIRLMKQSKYMHLDQTFIPTTIRKVTRHLAQCDLHIEYCGDFSVIVSHTKTLHDVQSN